jgi:hypothetical protein
MWKLRDFLSNYLSEKIEWRGTLDCPLPELHPSLLWSHATRFFDVGIIFNKAFRQKPRDLEPLRTTSEVEFQKMDKEKNFCAAIVKSAAQRCRNCVKHNGRHLELPLYSDVKYVSLDGFIFFVKATFGMSLLFRIILPFRRSNQLHSSGSILKTVNWKHNEHSEASFLRYIKIRPQPHSCYFKTSPFWLQAAHSRILADHIQHNLKTLRHYVR